MKAVDELLNQSGAWLNMGCGNGSLVSTRIRLARNINGNAFPGWSGDDESQRLWRSLSAVLSDMSIMQPNLVMEMNELDGVEREALVERHLISRELAEKGSGSGVVLRKDESVSVMINEEDHIRIQAMSSGFDPDGLWNLVDALDSELESLVDYAFSSKLGFLSACPTNVGTGLRASVMLHLPGLALMNEIKPIINGVSRLGMAVRGFWGEGTAACGNMFQVSNQVTLGESEQVIIGRLKQVVLELAEHEQNARLRMMQRRENVLRDCAARAVGILSNAILLDSNETMNLLSHLCLGIELDLVQDWDKTVIDDLFMLIQPGHLQKKAGKAIGAEQRDFERARLVRECLIRRKRG